MLFSAELNQLIQRGEGLYGDTAMADQHLKCSVFRYPAMK